MVYWEALDTPTVYPDIIVHHEEKGVMVTKHRPDGTQISPNIIVHKRGNNQDNLLVIELKKKSNHDRGGRAKDLEGLADLSRTNGDLKYHFEVFLEIDDITGAVGKTYYVNGTAKPSTILP